jgi:predicted AAA+ superfamily ATPase
MKQLSLFQLLTGGLETVIRNGNPWWRGEPIAELPPFRRWAFEPVYHRLTRGLAPAIVLRGPRQIGKTTLLNQVVDQLIRDGVDPRRLFRLQFDDLSDLKTLSMPIVELVDWYTREVLGETLNKAAAEGRAPFLFLDEVQNLSEWAPQLKHLLDLGKVRAMVTGSSALRIEAGRDSLAGRLQTIEMGPLLLREIAALRGFGDVPPYLAPDGLAPLKDKTFWRGLRTHGETHRDVRDRAFRAFAERGAYPVAQVRYDIPWGELADFLNETVVRRAITHDLRMGSRGQKRDEHLLEEVFRLACRYIGQSPSQAMYLEEIRRAMSANIGWKRILAYLKFLDGALLIRLIEPLELRLKKRRGASKLCLCDPALRAAWLQEVIPLDDTSLAAAPHLYDLAGHIAESVVGYFFRSVIGLDVAHFPERSAEPEVDFVLTVGEQHIPVEVKYRRRIDHRDTLGLRSFIEKAHYNAPFGVLVTMLDEPGTDDPRILSVPLASFLLLR